MFIITSFSTYPYLILFNCLIRNLAVPFSAKVQNNSWGLTTDKVLCFRSGNLACVRALLEVNSKSLHSMEYRLRTALHFAAYEGHLHLVKFLLENGANPDQR